MRSSDPMFSGYAETASRTSGVLIRKRKSSPFFSSLSFLFFFSFPRLSLSSHSSVCIANIQFVKHVATRKSYSRVKEFRTKHHPSSFFPFFFSVASSFLPFSRFWFCSNRFVATQHFDGPQQRERKYIQDTLTPKTSVSSSLPSPSPPFFSSVGFFLSSSIVFRGSRQLS